MGNIDFTWRFLKYILETKGYKYNITPQIQNEIICIGGTIVLKSIVIKINSAHSYSVLADKATDISTQKQHYAFFMLMCKKISMKVSKNVL